MAILSNAGRSRYLWIIHTVGWLLFISLPLTIMSREPRSGIQLEMLTSFSFWAFVLVYFLIFYINLRFLVPRLFFRQQYVVYSFLFLAGFSIVYVSQPFEKLIFTQFQEHRERQPPPREIFPEQMPPPPRAERPVTVDFVSLILFAVIWIIGMAVRLSEQWRLSERRVLLSEADKAQAELSFFKAQINPHFLFNTLNNIYALAISQHPHTAPSILKLSEMMRYITEEATEDFVPAAEEIACLENYIDLQKLRLTGKTIVDFSVSGDFKAIKIAPLVLMTFVENAFKYGVSNRSDATITIRLTRANRQIIFVCTNRIFEGNAVESTGIGISNTRKRLDFLYPDNYALAIRNDGMQFHVELKLAEK